MLVEIPTGDEFMDNIVAFWRPQEVLVAGQEYRLAYRLTWTRDQPDVGHLPAFLHESRGREHHRPGYRRYVIDVATQAEDATSDLSVSEGGETTGVSIFKLPDQGVMRITFLFSPGDQQTCEIRLSLRAADGSPLSPVWLRRWTPARDKGV
jgi:glucans biosynthesis protein